MKFSLLLLIIALLPGGILCNEDNVDDDEQSFAVKLTLDTFDEALKKNNHFVKFYAPWCGHCKRLQPLWEELAQIMNERDDPKVVISKVDCTQHVQLCNKHEITGYPTLRFFNKGENESVKFKGTRDMPAITEFINQQLRTAEETDALQDSNVQTESNSRLVDLTDENFARHVSSGNHFVKFYAPWCSHCQNLAPTWEKLSKSLEKESSVSIGKIDCTLYRPICQDFEVKGFPTLLWIEDGKKIEKYSGSREHDQLKAYVEKMMGTETKQELPSAVEDERNANKLQVLQLTGDDFKKSIDDGIVFVKFYAPWCGHCQKLSPIWDQLAEKMHSDGNGIKIAKVDCTAAENKALCMEQEIDGYPSLFAFKNGVKQSEYDGTRSLPELQFYIKKFISHDEL